MGLIETLAGAGLVVHGKRSSRTRPHCLLGRTFGDFEQGGFDLLVDDMVHLSFIAKEESPRSHSSCLGIVWGLLQRNNTPSVMASYRRPRPFRVRCS